VAVTPKFDDVPAVVERRTITDLEAWPYPKQQLVPLTEVVHDRLNVEIFPRLHAGAASARRDDHSPGP